MATQPTIRCSNIFRSHPKLILRPGNKRRSCATGSVCYLDRQRAGLAPTSVIKAALFRLARPFPESRWEPITKPRLRCERALSGRGAASRALDGPMDQDTLITNGGWIQAPGVPRHRRPRRYHSAVWLTACITWTSRASAIVAGTRTPSNSASML